MKDFIYMITLAFLFLSVELRAEVLENYLNKVEKNDFRLKSLIHQLKSKDYVVEQAKSKIKPQIRISSYLGWQKYKPYYGGETSQTLKYFYISLTQPIYHPEYLTQIKNSKVYKAIAKIKVEQEKQYIRYLFLNTLFNYLYSKEQFNINAEIYKLQKERYILATKLKEKKLLTDEEYLKIESDYENSFIELKNSEIELKSLKKELSIFLGEDLKKDINITFNQNLDLSGYVYDYKYLLDNLKNNFEIREARKNIDLALMEIRKRSKARLPKVDLELSYRYASTSAVSVASEDKRVALIIDFPIYQGGFIGASMLEAQELRKSADADYLQKYKEKKLELKDNLYQMKQAYSRLEKLKSQREIYKKIYEKIYIGYQKGVKTKLDVINSQINLLQIKLNILSEFHKFTVAYVKLDYTIANLNNKEIKKLEKFLQ